MGGGKRAKEFLNKRNVNGQKTWKKQKNVPCTVQGMLRVAGGSRVGRAGPWRALSPLPQRLDLLLMPGFSVMAQTGCPGELKRHRGN